MRIKNILGLLYLIPLLAVLGALTYPSEARAQYRTIDLGSPDPIEVGVIGDPLSLIRIPPGAFGNHPPGTLATIGIDIPLCDGPGCLGGRAYLVSFNDGGCCGGGALVRPVTVELRYDEEEVQRFGIQEEDVVLARYDADHRQWTALANLKVDPERNVVSGVEGNNIRLFVGVFAFSPQPAAPASWGRIKALFRGGMAR